MKKKWLLVLLAAAACIAGTFGLSACGEHEHKWSAWSVTETPTATAAGKATRTCSGSGDCDAASTDKEYTLPDLTSADYTLSDNTATCTAAGTATYAYNKSGVTVSFTAASNATGHDYGTDGVCANCGETEPSSKHVHDWNDWTLTAENKPTTEQTGKVTRTCKNADCDAELSDKEYTLPELTSEDYSKSTDSATCTAPGKMTYTYNKDGVSVSFEVATPARHSELILTNKYPTCTETGLTEGKKCSVCLEILVAQETVPALGHIEGILPAVSATCTEDGLTEGKKCSICQTILEEQNVIAAAGHSLDTTVTPTVDETNKTVSTRCTTCNKTVVYGYDDAINATEATAIGSAIPLSSGVNYVSQTASAASRPPYLKFAFTEAGTYTIYWMGLDNSTFSLRPATIIASSNTAFIDTSGNLKKASIPEDFALEGYLKGTLQYNVTDEDGNKSTVTGKAGDYVRLTADSFMSGQSQMSLTNLIPVSLTLNVAADTALGFRNYTNTTDTSYFLIGVNKEPTISAEYCTVAAGDFSINDTELEFMPITEQTAGTYTFTAETGKFELYVNGNLYSDGEKSCFGYVDFCDRYLTVTLQDNDEVKVVKVSGKASEKNFTIHEGTLEEPALPVYTTLQLGDQTINLTDTGIAIGKYEDKTEQFYAFTAPASGYYKISVADDVKVSAVIRVDKTHYSFVFDVANMNTHSGVFSAEAGKTVILAFVGNDKQEFDVNIASCEEPITYLEANEKLENISFAGFETIVKITVGDSVAEGTYKLTFDVPNILMRAYIYFTVNEEIEVDDPYDSNAIAEYVNADIAAGWNNTVYSGSRDLSDWDEDFSRTVNVKAGDVIYLATTSLTPGYLSVTLTPVA
ncbi:MAG: hypothetical protein K2O41_07035 [Clostridia bacterium]|nr:hypothetical protein [Clostridia bacterium]